MTVYNVTRLNKDLAANIAWFLNVNTRQIELLYSDWLNSFGCYVKHTKKKIPPVKRKTVNQIILDKMGTLPMNDILSCPVVTGRKEK